MMELFARVFRRFHPVMMKKHGDVLAERSAGLREAMKGFPSGGPAEEEGGACLMQASACVIEAVSRFKADDDMQSGVINAMKAARKVSQAREILFPLRCRIRAIDELFREPSYKSGMNKDEVPGHDLCADGDALIHLGEGSDPYARGAASLFIPGSGAGPGMRPLIIALHGGYGHGRDFIWTWLREARSRGLFLLAPTSQGMTWSLMDPEKELESLLPLVERIAADHPVDPGRVLLTGFSDGATLALQCAVQKETPFAAFNAISGVLPVQKPVMAIRRRILWIHGAHDWVFPPARAQAGFRMLVDAGADVRLKILDDLAHAYPMEENAGILSWFDAEFAPDQG